MPPPSVRPGDADRAGVAERGREAVRRGRHGELASRETGTGPREPTIRVDVDALERGHVDDDAVVDRAVAGEAVPAAADRQRQAGLGREPDRRGDVGGTGRADDHRGVLVVVRVADLAGLVIGVAAGDDQLALEVGGECLEIDRLEIVLAAGAEGFHRGGSFGVGRR